MDLIFEEGKRLYQTELKKMMDRQLEVVSKLMNGIKLLKYQKYMLENMVENIILDKSNNDSNFNIYGDDFKVEIIPVNIEGNCVITVKDYDEHQSLESEIRIDFTKDELSQLINLLNIVKEIINQK